MANWFGDASCDQRFSFTKEPEPTQTMMQGTGMLPRFNGLFPGINSMNPMNSAGAVNPGTQHGHHLGSAFGPAAQIQGSAVSSIREVWAANFEHEMHVLRELVERYNCISVEAEFPGIVARPIGSFKTTTDYHYQTLRCNVDLLHVIQLGITFADDHGNHPEGLPSTWQFNFKYSLSEEMYQSEMIDLLTKSGVDFKKHEEFGIEPAAFAELFISSGLVLEDSVKWISYHSGYDFGYLMAIMTNTALPADETEFLDLLRLFFPSLCDVKLMMRAATNKVIKGTLADLAEELRIARVGQAHQAGSEALLVSSCYFELLRIMQTNDITDDSYHNQLWGLI